VYQRHSRAPEILPHVEAQKAVRDAHSPRDPLSADPAGRKVYRLRPVTPAVGVSARIRAELDDEQLAVVEQARGRALVLASAGSGKTRAIVYKLAHLVETGTRPEAVVLLTFTRRAAREMVQRAEAACGSDLSAMAAGTFHAVCARILRHHGPLVGLPPVFTILDGEDQADLVRLARDAVIAGREQRRALPGPGVLAGWLSLAAETGRPLADVVVDQNPRLGDRLEEIGEIAEDYARRKREMAACDYADLLVLTDRLMTEHDRARRAVSGHVEWVLVDEFHDVSPIQARLAEALASGHGNLIAVADPDQSIYSWRGADPRAVELFVGVEGTRVFPLSTNYRSLPEIVEFAQASLPAGNPYGKSLRAVRPRRSQPPVVAHVASVEDEAAFVTQRIADLVTDGREPGEIGVLFRAHHHSVDLQLALTTAGVEFELYSGARFVESAHVKDVLAFCRMRHNARDELAWRRALRLFDRVGERAASRVWAAVSGAEEPLRAVAQVPLAGAPGMSLALFAGVAARIADLDRPEAIVLEVARSEWYRDHLQRAYPNWRDREADLARLAELGARAPGLERFLADLALAERVEFDEDVSGPAKRVALSTVHAAKGLEWPVVFVLGVEAGMFPSSWAVSEGNLEEEERLFYVAVTRAADELYLCRPMAAKRPWDTGANRVVLNAGMGFLDRDLTGLVEEWSIRLESPPSSSSA
jgi:DNA helicase-2/ATP-dependent DNA helicase PcrA